MLWFFIQLICILAVLLAIPYVIFTLLAHGQVTYSDKLITANLAPDDLPEDVVQHFVKPAQALATNDFTPVAYFSIANYTPDAFTFVAFWTNPQTSDVATVTVHLGGGERAVRPQEHRRPHRLLCAVRQRLSRADEQQPRDAVVQARADPEHRACARRRERRRRVPVAPEPRAAPRAAGRREVRTAAGRGDELVQAAAHRWLKQQLATGYLEPGEQEGMYRASWVGSLMISTVKFPPLSKVRRWQMAEKAEADLKLARGPVRGVR
jgi:hypothetical protein